jgi:hypothetical protein
MKLDTTSGLYTAFIGGKLRTEAEFLQMLHDAPESSAFSSILGDLKRGRFAAVEELRRFVAHRSYEIREFARQLLADTCNHEQVAIFSAAMGAIADPTELRRIVLHLGECLSPCAIAIMDKLNRTYGEDEETAEDILLSTGVLFDPDETFNTPADQHSIEQLLRMAQGRLPAGCYYYHGRPAFLGDVSKELVTAALISNRERRPVMLVSQNQILTSSTGVTCPVEHGQIVTDEDMEAVFAYVEAVGRFPWNKGAKYFFRHQVT